MPHRRGRERLRQRGQHLPGAPRVSPAARPGSERLGAARPGPARLGTARLGHSPPIMQSYKYDKAIPPESKNGGSPALNNNPAKSSSKKALLICLDFLCLVMGEQPRGSAPLPSAPSPSEPPQPPGLPLRKSSAEGGQSSAVPRPRRFPKQKRSGARSGAAGRGEPRSGGAGRGRVAGPGGGERVPPRCRRGWGAAVRRGGGHRTPSARRFTRC